MIHFTLALNVCGKNTLETRRNKTDGKKRMNKNKKRNPVIWNGEGPRYNPVAQELRTPKYRSRVVQDKRKKQEKIMSYKEVIEQARKFLGE